MGRVSWVTWVSCVMGHMGHGSVVRWVTWVSCVMGHMGHGSVVSWVTWVMGQLCHGSHGSWVTKYDQQFAAKSFFLFPKHCVHKTDNRQTNSRTDKQMDSAIAYSPLLSGGSLIKGKTRLEWRTNGQVSNIMCPRNLSWQGIKSWAYSASQQQYLFRQKAGKPEGKKPTLADSHTNSYNKQKRIKNRKEKN